MNEELTNALKQDCNHAIKIADRADEREEHLVLVDISLLYRLASNLYMLLDKQR